jgi:hypothetical protein
MHGAYRRKIPALIAEDYGGPGLLQFPKQLVNVNPIFDHIDLLQ